AKYHVGVEILVASKEDVGDKRLAAGITDHEVHVCWAKRVPPLGLQHIADRAVVRYGIGSRYDGTEPEVALRIRAKTGAACQPFQTRWSLYVVKPIAIRMPAVDESTCDRRAVNT